MSTVITRRPTVVDLFAGAGGLSLGFEQAGFDVVAAVEFDPIHAAVHKLNFPHTAVICRSVRDVTGEMIRAEAGIGRSAIDVVIGGPPCQGFSLIGHRVLNDPRNDLVFHFVRVVDELRPKAFLMENVPGMAAGQHHQLLDEVIAQFEAIGYKLQLPYKILNAANYGVPQDRKRLVLIGTREGIKVPRYPTPRTAMPANKRRGRNAELFELPMVPTVADAFSDLPDIETFESLSDSDILRVRLEGGSSYARTLRGDVSDPDDYSYKRNTSDELTGCLRANHTDLSRARFAATVPGETEPISRFFRLPPDGLSNTLRAGTASDRGAFSAPRPIHPDYPRCISVREAARLHSYPDWFRFHRTIWHGFRQIGNSVPPFLGRAVAAEIREALGINPVKPIDVIELGPRELASLNMTGAAAHFGLAAPAIASRTRTAAR